jgi:LPXTG-motif cell wall-anchored protein
MKQIKFSIILAVLLTIGMAGFLTRSAQATPGAGAIWTTNIDCGVDTQDENHYAKGSWVYINGANFDPGIYSWFIEGQPGNASDDPNVIVAQGSFTVDETGAFCFAAYQVQMDDGGEYKADFDGKKDNYRVLRGSASVSLNIESCEELDSSRAARSVSLILTGASLTIGGNTYTSSTTIQLETGSYPYEWHALPGYTGSGSGTLVVPECEEQVENALVSIEIGTCEEEWEDRVSSKSVSLFIVGATLTINGEEYTSNDTIYLAPGSYPYSWVSLPGYVGSGSGVLIITDCNDQEASSVMLDLGECTPDGNGSTYRPLSITLVRASLTINDVTYTESTIINLPVGIYSYSWSGLDESSGESSIEVVPSESCLPSPDPTPTPTSSPTTGASDSPAIYAILGAASLLIAGTSLLLWRKKVVAK